MPISDTVWLEDEHTVGIIDQSLLPGAVQAAYLHTPQELYEAIQALRVRGAPAIGVAAAFGMYCFSHAIAQASYDDFWAAFTQCKDYLDSARPTAVNLHWALGRMAACLAPSMDPGERLAALRRTCIAIRDEDVAACRSIGEAALRFLRPGMSILTHCNAGRLATVRYGTATAAMYLGMERGYRFHIYCDETRPLLQGARLTAFELSQAGMKVTLLCDSMAASRMQQGKISAVLVGADRIARNGDTANKIGTLGVALAAHHYHVPFYVCAPTSTLDLQTASGQEIVIEERDPREVTELWYAHPMAPAGIAVENPAFDVTPYDLISAIITEDGVYTPS